MEPPAQIASLFEFLPDAIVLTDMDGVIVDVNVQTTKLFGYDRNELLGKEIEILVPEATRNAHRGHRARYSGNQTFRPMGPGLDLNGRRKDGVMFPVEISLSPFETPEGKGVISVLRDVTGRVTLEEVVRESEERYRSLVELSPEAIVVHTKGIIVYVNEAAMRLFLVGSRDDIINKSFLDFVPPDYIEEVKHRVAHVLEPGERRESLLIKGNRSDGQEFVLEGLASGVLFRGERAVQVILRDITSRVKAEEELKSSREELRSLSTYLQSAREAERTSIAREIHDELGGALTSLKMDLASFEEALTTEAQEDLGRAILDRVESMSDLIDSTVKTMRRIITDLRPVLLDSLGLSAAMEWYAEEFQNRTGVTCEVMMQEEPLPLDRDRSTAVFRIFQETLTNVARHAEATSVNVDMTIRDDILTLRVSDNGKGIEEEQVKHAKSFGLLGMRERALIFGGEVTISGAPGRGTTVIMTMPFETPGTG